MTDDNQPAAPVERKPFTLPWTREERAEFALSPWSELFTPPQFKAAVRQIASQITCHVEKDLVHPSTYHDCQRELAFFFGYWHDQQNHRASSAACMENECVRVRQVLLHQPASLVHQPPVVSERCDVSVTGKHRIDAPYCKDCGQTFVSATTGAGVGEQSFQRRLFEECRTANWDPELKNTFAEEVAHLHEELSEAFRAFRRNGDFRITVDANGKPQGVPIELADVLIGLFYNAELHGFDLFAAVEQKHNYNLTRNYVTEGRQLHAAPFVVGVKGEQRLKGAPCAECDKLSTHPIHDADSGFRDAHAYAPPAAAAEGWRDGHHWHTRVDAPSYCCDCQGEPCIAFNVGITATGETPPGRCIHCDPSFVPTGPDGWCECRCHDKELLDPAPAPIIAGVAAHDLRADGCKCQRCGTRYKVDVMVSDELWSKIHGDENLLCGPCVIGSIENLGAFGYYTFTHGNQRAIDLLDKWLSEHPDVEHDEHLDQLIKAINENSLSDRQPSTIAPGEGAAHIDAILQSIVETPAGERIRMKCGAADLRSIITDTLAHFPPTEPTQAGVEAATDEIASFVFNLCEETLDNELTPDDNTMQAFKEIVTAIISKHCAVLAEAGEVERLRTEVARLQRFERELSTLRVGYALEKGLAKNFQKQITKHSADLTETRSTTIQSCIDIVNNASIIPFAGVAYVDRDQVVRKLEALSKERYEDRERCRAARSDGECQWDQCPQLRDGEPAKTGRHCPLDTWVDTDE